MKRIIIGGTIALLVAIIAGTTLGDDALLEVFSASDAASQVVRVLLIGLLGALLLTTPPRNLNFRTVLGFASGILTLGSMLLLSQNLMSLLDAVVFVEVAIILAIEAIEAPLTEKPVRAQSKGAYSTQNKKVAI